MPKKPWKFDVRDMTLDDLVLLEEMRGAGANFKDLRSLLQRYIVGRHKKEIGGMTIAELNEATTALGKAIEEAMEPPKENSTG